MTLSIDGMELTNTMSVAGLFLVDCGLLEAKLCALSIRGRMLNFILSFLSDGSIVVVNGVQSTKYTAKLEVDQESVLRSFLFVLFVNTVADFIPLGHLASYADDTSTTTVADSVEQLEFLIVGDTHAFEEWCRRNRLILNSNKTVKINFENDMYMYIFRDHNILTLTCIYIYRCVF